jgi:3-oxo-5-alpha-steroid 4-dehydrogenase 3
VVCPHYTAECVIFASLAVAAAPAGHLVNATLMTTLAFTVINLGATAESSKAWYARKFGEDSVKDKWRMIPGVF